VGGQHRHGAAQPPKSSGPPQKLGSWKPRRK
jgi:hypothetical protein